MLFQRFWNVKRISVIIAGFTTGITTAHKRWNSLHPSILAASISEIGIICTRNCRIRNTPNGIARIGRSKAKYVFNICSFAIIRYWATAVTGLVNKRAFTIRSEIRLLPLKLPNANE